MTKVVAASRKVLQSQLSLTRTVLLLGGEQPHPLSHHHHQQQQQQHYHQEQHPLGQHRTTSRDQGTTGKRTISSSPTSSETPSASSEWVDSLTEVQWLWNAKCEATGGSVGSHVRHSLDHFSRAIRTLAIPSKFSVLFEDDDKPNSNDESDRNLDSSVSTSDPNCNSRSNPGEFVRTGIRADYDTRARGTGVEKSPQQALDALQAQDEELERIMQIGMADESVLYQPVQVSFMIDSASGEIATFYSTFLRELWFAAHHAVHHNAVIATILKGESTGELGTKVLRDLPEDFSKAPSTAFSYQAARL